MKFAQLLFMGTVLAASTNATAMVVDGVRQKPIPQKSALQFGKPMYLYNVGSKQFFKGANDYDTRGSVGEIGYKVWVTQHLDEGGAWDNQSVIIKDSVENQKAIKMTWAAANGDLWVDWKDQADTLWAVQAQADDIYRLTVGAGNVNFSAEKFPGVYLGIKGAEAASNTRLYWNLEAADNFVDWYFVSEADGAAYNAAYELYATAQILKSAIDEAKTKGVDVAAQEAVYLNEAAAKDELEAATKVVREAMAKADEQAASPTNPMDKTSLIVNPSYETNKNDGWKGDTPKFQSYTNAEFYDKNYNYYQDINDAPKGVYAVSLSAFYRAGNSSASFTNFKNQTNQNAKLYAKVGEDSLNVSILNPFAEALTSPKGMGESSATEDGITYYIPNDMKTGAAYFNDGLYAGNKLIFSTEDGAMRIGLKKNTKVGADWTLFDNWKLTYYGNGADAYTMWLNEAKKSAKDYSSIVGEKLVTHGMVDAYNAKIAGLTSASSKQDVLDAIKLIETESLAIDSNMIAWTAYQEAVDRGKVIAADENITGSDKDDLGDYCDLTAGEILGEATLTTEEVRAETQKLLTMIDNAIKNGIKEGTDVSDKYLVNANFEKTNGWTVKKADGGNVAYGGNSDNHCFEAWNNKDFDIYQEVKGAPVGVYELSLQGFYRYGRGDNAYKAYTEGTANNDVVDIYVNNNATHFKSVFDEQVPYSGNKTGELYKYEGGNPPYINPDSTYWYPNDMAVAATAFRNGLYKVSSFGVVAKAGDVLRVGVKGSTDQLKDSWAIWDNFQMVFQGTKAEVVKPLLEQQIAVTKAEAETTDPMGKSVLENANAAIADANTKLAGGDGKTMFAALTALLESSDSISASVALFKQLQTKKEDLNAAYVSSTAVQATKDEAARLLEAIESGLDAKSLENAQATDYINKVNVMVSKLAIPAEAASASDDNPVDLTMAIKTPGFEKDGANSVEGWNADGYSFGNSDAQKSALLLEFFHTKFDLNQTIDGLPNGTYEVKVDAFYRFGTASEDYKKYTADKNTEGNAWLYAVAGDTVRTAVRLLASGASEDKGYTGSSQIADTELFVPNDMISAKSYFSDDAYQNSITVKVTDGKLTIGVKQDKNVDNDWVILDNWKLTYFGPNSTKPVTSIDEAQVSEVAKTEVFSINGVKKNALTRGINIVKTTMADGTVKVTKVVVK